MSILKSALTALTLTLISLPGYSASVTATADTLDNAESIIHKKADQQGKDYRITEAYFGNRVHMTAALTE